MINLIVLLVVMIGVLAISGISYMAIMNYHVDRAYKQMRHLHKKYV